MGAQGSPTRPLQVASGAGGGGERGFLGAGRPRAIALVLAELCGDSALGFSLAAAQSLWALRLPEAQPGAHGYLSAHEGPESLPSVVLWAWLWPTSRSRLGGSPGTSLSWGRLSAFLLMTVPEVDFLMTLTSLGMLRLWLQAECIVQARC